MTDTFTPDTILWNVEHERYTPYPQTKFHVDRGDGLARCSRRTVLGTPVGGLGSWGDSGFDLGRLRRDHICRRCIPMLPSWHQDAERGD